MSASLVGSEMCIRDSAELAEDAALCAARMLGLLAEHQPAVPTLHPDTVSYTHLTLPTICSV
eukprot:6275053-Alexandrium_andersonii.AAC.1